MISYIFNYENLTTLIKEFDEEEKEQQKREDDELFNKLSAMKKQRKEYKQIGSYIRIKITYNFIEKI